MNTETTCTACKSLSRMGIKCNAHRTESRGAELIREARAAGHDLQGTYAEQAIAAERALNARSVVIN